jgi:VWFA-related protein
MKYQLFALSLAAACVFPSLAAAQSKPTDIYVSVVDSKGDPAKGLTPSDFQVREDGTPREVLKVAPAAERLTIALLVDDSQAARSAVQMIREAVAGFITELSGKAEISIVTFGERPAIAVNYTTDTKRLLDVANRIFPRTGSGAYLMEAIVEVSKGLQKRKPARPVIVALTLDNEVEFSNEDYRNVLAAVDKSGAALNIVALGVPGSSQSDEMRNRNQVIAQGTERTGGRRDNVLALTAAAQAMKRVADDLLNQYLVTYARPETLIPPDKIEVTVTRPGLTARARQHTGEAAAR